MVISYYKRKRIININLNIILAGFISIFLTSFPVSYLQMFFENEIAIVILSFLFEGVTDFLVFAALHAVLHLKRATYGVFLEDLVSLQKQRIVLAVLFFFLATGGHYLLIMSGFDVTKSFVISYAVSLVITRVVHTVYGIKTGLFEKTY